MVRHQIELDEDTDRALTDLARDFGGNLNEALTELMRSRESVESFLDHCEDAQHRTLHQQKTDSERDFQSGNTISWEDLKRRNHL